MPTALSFIHKADDLPTFGAVHAAFENCRSGGKISCQSLKPLVEIGNRGMLGNLAESKTSV